MRVPFKNFDPDWTKAASQVRRDFEELENQWAPGTSPYDAIINPTLTRSLPGSHAYKNLSDVIANEHSWSGTRAFRIGVIVTSTAIVETADMVNPGPFTIEALGGKRLGGAGPKVSPETLPTWDFNGHAITGFTSYPVYIRGLHLKNTGGLRDAYYIPQAGSGS